MAQITFSFTIGTRGDSTPGDRGFTYHHVLPWRYYYTLGRILVEVVRLKVAGTKDSFGEDAAIDEFRQGFKDGKAVGKAYGADYSAFLADDTHSPSDLVKVINKLGKVGNPGYRVASLIATDPHTISNQCGAPYGGGFLGPAPEHRTDDPKTEFEPKRPISVKTGLWSALSLIRTRLESCCPALAAAKSGTKITATVSNDDLDQFLASIDDVTNWTGAPGFDPEDWSFVGTGGRGGNKVWHWIDPDKLTAATVAPYEAKGTKAGQIFKLRAAAEVNKGAKLDPANIDDDTDPDDNPIAVRTYNPKLTDRKNFKFHNK
jgi:hypothetical protein